MAHSSEYMALLNTFTTLLKRCKPMVMKYGAFEEEKDYFDGKNVSFKRI